MTLIIGGGTENSFGDPYSKFCCYHIPYSISLGV